MKSNIINKVISQYEEKLKDKPRFEMGSLYCGEIVLLEKRTFDESNAPEHVFLPVKKFAIFITMNGNTYTHVKSHQKMKHLASANINDYAINNLQHFKDFFADRMHEMDYNEQTKVSFNDIVAIEDFENDLLCPNHESTELCQ